MFSWAVTAALTGLICLRRQDEREGQPIKGCHLESEKEKWGGDVRLDGQGRDPSFNAKLKVTSPRWAIK